MKQEQLFLRNNNEELTGDSNYAYYYIITNKEVREMMVILIVKIKSNQMSSSASSVSGTICFEVTDEAEVNSLESSRKLNPKITFDIKYSISYVILILLTWFTVSFISHYE